jgi:hypothetical protein
MIFMVSSTHLLPLCSVFLVIMRNSCFVILFCFCTFFWKKTFLGNSFSFLTMDHGPDFATVEEVRAIGKDATQQSIMAARQFVLELVPAEFTPSDTRIVVIETLCDAFKRSRACSDARASSSDEATRKRAFIQKLIAPDLCNVLKVEDVLPAMGYWLQTNADDFKTQVKEVFTCKLREWRQLYEQRVQAERAAAQEERRRRQAAEHQERMTAQAAAHAERMRHEREIQEMQERRLAAKSVCCASSGNAKSSHTSLHRPHRRNHKAT